MAIFDRIRRGRSDEVDVRPEPLPEPVAAHLLPEINQRLTIATAQHIPVASRVEDVDAGMLQLAYPGLALEPEDTVVVSWERDGTWCSLETQVTMTDGHAAVPTIGVAAAGRLRRFDDRRGDLSCAIELPIEVRVLRARGIQPGRTLRTVTTEVGATALSFITTAPLAPEDQFEVRLQVSDGTTDIVSARVHVIRVEAVAGTPPRSICTVSFDELLRSDRARLLSLAASRTSASSTGALPPTQDGIGGRDEPEPLTDYSSVLDWLRRKG